MAYIRFSCKFGVECLHACVGTAMTTSVSRNVVLILNVAFLQVNPDPAELWWLQFQASLSKLRFYLFPTNDVSSPTAWTMIFSPSYKTFGVSLILDVAVILSQTIDCVDIPGSGYVRLVFFLFRVHRIE